ncbi:MAG: hypothetical protein ACREBC_26335, partial [Pyrinomonadaceae bacterium]
MGRLTRLRTVATFFGAQHQLHLDCGWDRHRGAEADLISGVVGASRERDAGAGGVLTADKRARQRLDRVQRYPYP